MPRRPASASCTTCCAARSRFERRADGRPGAAQERRLPDLSPGQRGRRPPDGDQPRDPRRGVALVAAEARAALPGLRLGAAGLLPPAAPAQRRQVEDLEAQEPGQPQLLPARRLSSRRRCSTSWRSWAARCPTSARSSRSRSSSQAFTLERISLGGPVFDLEKLDLAQRQVPAPAARRRSCSRGCARHLLSDEYLLRGAAARAASASTRSRASSTTRRSSSRASSAYDAQALRGDGPEGPHAGARRASCSRALLEEQRRPARSTGRAATLEAASARLRRERGLAGQGRSS